MEHSYFFRTLRAMLRRAIGAPKPPHPEQFDLSHARPRVDEREYGKNLADIADVCVRQGVRPVFLLFRDNPLEAGPLHAAIATLERGETQAAIRALEEIVSHAEVANVARLTLATAYRRAGRLKEADDILKIRYSNDALGGMDPVRLDSAYARVMQDVARASGIELVDAASVLERPPNVFVDESHFNKEGHRRVGELLAARISRLLVQ
jgi:hypothetical protein